MSRTSKLVCGFLVFLCPTGAYAENYKVERTLSITASAKDAWDYVGDFCDIDDWHPAISSCSLKVIDGALHRVLGLAEGGEVIEKRIASEPGLSYTYRIVEAPLPIEKYTATLSITRGDPSVITWSGRFASDDPAMEELFNAIYDAGMASIAERLAQ